MRFWLDTEFNGHGGDLISLAMVGVREEWYRAVICGGSIDPWVADHVMPKLNSEPLHPILFRLQFHEFILRLDNPEIICDWHADAEHFCRLLGGPEYGSSLDFACRMTILRTPADVIVSAVPHNALEDARALRDWHLRQEKSFVAT